MYKTIYIPVDNSDHSNQAVDVGIELAKVFGSKIVGSHVYAAKMHDKRCKQMEAGLPEEYRSKAGTGKSSPKTSTPTVTILSSWEPWASAPSRTA